VFRFLTVVDMESMAVEETEYFSLNQGNGLSPVARPQKNSGSKTAAKKAQAPQRSSLTSFFQGITLGTVLLIPVGVWCWVRIGAPSSQEVPAIEEAHPTKAKQPAGAAWKRKPVKAHVAPAGFPPPPVHQAVSAPVTPLAEPPPLALTPTPPLTIPTSNLVPRVDDQNQFNDSAQKPKKGVWKTITSPFRGKGHSAPGTDPLPPGQ
jgi:hypothetical protein